MNLNADEQQRINNVYNEREQVLAENNSMYEGLINQADEMRNQQNAYLAQEEQIQNQNLDKQLDYQTGLINQQKEEAAANKRVEENKAMNDYQAYINPYGIQNERLYGAGLGNSGVSETSKLGAYTTYQNRVATGAAAYQKAIQGYDNAINQAILNNDVQKAQNALNKLKLELQNNQEYYTNVSSLSQNKLNNANQLRSTYMDQYNNVYNQILKEQSEREAIRQYNEQMEFNRQKQAEAVRQFNEELAFNKAKQAEAVRQFNEQLKLQKSKSSGSGGGGRSSGGSRKSTNKNRNKLTGSSSRYSELSKALATDKGYNSAYSKKVWENQLNKAYSNGQISKSDLKKLISQM